MCVVSRHSWGVRLESILPNAFASMLFPGQSVKEDVVSTGSGDFEGSLSHILSSNL